MEQKTFKFIKNLLLPIKSTIEIGPEGVTNKGKFVAWKDIESCSYSITSINRAMNYIIHYTDKTGKTHRLNYIVTVTGSKKKKQMFMEIYQMFHEGLSKNVIIPKAEKLAEDVKKGLEVELANSTLNNQGISVAKPLKKKQTVFIPFDEIKITHRDGSGGFDVQSSKNDKERGYFQYELPDSRVLLATLEKLFPEQAEVYKN